MSYENQVQLLIKCVGGSIFDRVGGLIKRVGDPLHCSEKKLSRNYYGFTNVISCVHVLLFLIGAGIREGIKG